MIKTKKMKDDSSDSNRKNKTIPLHQVYSCNNTISFLQSPRFQDGGYMHCSGPDFTRIIYAVSKFHSMVHAWSCVHVYRRHAHAERPVGLPNSAVTLNRALMNCSVCTTRLKQKTTLEAFKFHDQEVQYTQREFFRKVRH